MFSPVMADVCHATVPLVGICSVLQLLKLLSTKQLRMAHQRSIYIQGVLVGHDLHTPFS